MTFDTKTDDVSGFLRVIGRASHTDDAPASQRVRQSDVYKRSLARAYDLDLRHRGEIAKAARKTALSA